MKWLLAGLLFGAAVGCALIVHFTPHVHWIQAWAPGAAIAFFQLGVAASAVEWVLDRIREREAAPSRRMALAQARAIDRESTTLLQILSNTYRLQQGVTTTGQTSIELLAEHPDALQHTDLNAQASVVPARPLGLFLTVQMEAVKQAHNIGGSVIATYATADIAEAVFDLIHGRGSMFINICRQVLPAMYSYNGAYPNFTQDPDAGGLGRFVAAAQRLSDAVAAQAEQP